MKLFYILNTKRNFTFFSFQISDFLLEIIIVFFFAVRNFKFFGEISYFRVNP